MKKKQVLAVDYGASSGRVMLGSFDGSSVSVRELHRFSNDPVMLGDTMYWDVLRLFHEMKQGILKSKTFGPVSGIGVDTWGVDFGLLDREGRLLDNPVHYRDRRTEGILDDVMGQADAEWIYEVTGNQIMEINTLFQLAALKQQRPGFFEQVDTLLLMPDLFRYFLSGIQNSEISIASTTQMMDIRRKDWSRTLLKKLEVPDRMLKPVIPGAVCTGSLRTSLQRELDVPAVKIIAVAGHDTQSAMAAIPATEEDFLFISCGTWALFGTERKEPIVSEMSRKYNLTNEAALEGRYAFLKNIIGLWLIQESRRQWMREGKEYSFSELERKAGKAVPFRSVIDPQAPEFVPAGNMPERIRMFCRSTGQPIPESEGDIICCINQSLALTYRKTLEELQACTGKRYPVLHLIGGGAQSALLCQMTANACGIPVLAGPVEATVYGNTAAQLMALGEIGSLNQVRELLAAAENIVVYEPMDIPAWEEAYLEYREMIEKRERTSCS